MLAWNTVDNIASCSISDRQDRPSKCLTHLMTYKPTQHLDLLPPWQSTPLTSSIESLRSPVLQVFQVRKWHLNCIIANWQLIDCSNIDKYLMTHVCQSFPSRLMFSCSPERLTGITRLTDLKMTIYVPDCHARLILLCCFKINRCSNLTAYPILGKPEATSVRRSCSPQLSETRFQKILDCKILQWVLW